MQDSISNDKKKKKKLKSIFLNVYILFIFLKLN